MELVVKTFYELSNDEIFDIYKLRFDVFVCEQNCVYQDIDEYDKKAIHVYYKDNDKIVAYLRVIPQGVRFLEASIGRVISMQRRTGLGTKIVSKAIEIAINEFKAETIYLEAQSYARKLYENLGFKKCGDEFVEDGIPHTPMRLVVNEN